METVEAAPTTVAETTTTAVPEATTTTTTTAVPEVIVDPDLFDEDGEAIDPEDQADGDEDVDADEDATETTTTTTTTSTTTTTTTTTTSTTTTTTQAPPTTQPGTGIVQELDRVLNLLPDDIEDLLLEIDVLGDQLAFGVASEEDAEKVDEFLSRTTAAPYSIRLAG